jgi:hypothetical protein
MSERIAPLEMAGAPTEGDHADRGARLSGVRGHRDFMSTTCPGDELAAFARRLDREYFGKAGGGRGTLAT